METHYQRSTLLNRLILNNKASSYTSCSLKIVFSFLLTTFISQSFNAQTWIAPVDCIEFNGVWMHCGGSLNIPPDEDNLLGGDHITGLGCKLFWQINKCAIRGGQLLKDPLWDEDSLGMASASFGQDTKALGDESFSAGRDAHALDDRSVAMGNNVIAQGLTSVALGHSSNAVGQSSISVGHQVVSSGSGSTTLGSHSLSSNIRTMTIGKYLTASGQNNMVIGLGNDFLDHLENPISRSLMIGFGSNLPTVFVERASSFNRIGKVAIGHTDPDQTLDIAGAIRIDTSSTNVDGSMRFTGTSFEGHTNGSWVGLAGDGDTGVFSLNNTDANYATGNVGIGSSNPSTALEVNGDVTITGSVVGPSDQRLKTNVATITDALSIIRKLQVSKFSFKSDSDLNTPTINQYGFLAQDISKVLPALVDARALKVKNGSSYMGLDQQKLIPILIQALKELEEENQKLHIQYDQELALIEQQIE